MGRLKISLEFREIVCSPWYANLDINVENEMALLGGPGLDSLPNPVAQEFYLPVERHRVTGPAAEERLQSG